MRLTLHDPGATLWDAYYYRRRLEYPQIADEELGTVECLVGDAEGRIVLNERHEPVTVTLCGPVEVIPAAYREHVMRGGGQVQHLPIREWLKSNPPACDPGLVALQGREACIRWNQQRAQRGGEL